VSATTVLLTLPTDVVHRALRAAAVAVVPLVAVVPALTRSAATQASFAETAEAAAHEGEKQPCPWCQHRGHIVRWRAYPVLDPGPCPTGGVLTEQVDSCCCCLWGTGPGPQRLAEPLMDRLQREAHHGRDIHVEHLGRDGRWTRFETRF
jgi:hypothetical protein